MEEAIIAVISVLVTIGAVYFPYRAERRERKRLEVENRELQSRLSREQREHELALERRRERNALIAKVSDEYMTMVRRNLDSGPHALARIGVERLGSDEAIREAIAIIDLQAKDPWSSQAHLVENLDLFAFFRYVRLNNVDFFKTSVESVANAVRESGGTRVRAATPVDGSSRGEGVS